MTSPSRQKECSLMSVKQIKKRGRGRPPKHSDQSLAQKINKRGRPLKHKHEAAQSFAEKEFVEVEGRREPICYKRRKTSTHDLYENEEAKTKRAVMERAREVQANLSPQFPSIIKYMLHSHVTRGFWLGLPNRFCSRYLPKEDTMMILEDEKGEEFEAKYLAVKVGLSGGWRGFSISHKIMEGDTAVFQLVKPNKFKVYIVRSNGLDELDGALGLLNLEACNQMDIDGCEKYVNNEISFKEEAEERYFKDAPALGNIPMEQNQKNISANLEQVPSHSENDSEDHESEILDGIMFVKSVADFTEVRSIEDFTILANGLIINSQLSKHLQAKYYELCTSQKAYLHDHLLKGLNCQLVAGMIAETINIADAIRAAKLATPCGNFGAWLETLKSFQGLGMSVGFLLGRLEQLMNLSLKWMRYEEAREEQVKATEEKRTLELKLLEVNEKLKSIDMEVKKLKDSDGQGLDQLFREVASGPW